MSLFNERAANAKKVVQLQNEIFSLKNKMKTLSESSSSKEDLERVQLENSALSNQIQDLRSELQNTTSSVETFKADNKKLRSENTRLKKKLAQASSEE